MKLIAGLGNPTKEYDGTRHNAGFEVIDYIAGKLGVSVKEKKHKGLIACGVFNGEKILLLKPQTYMNLSGESIRAAADFYKLELEDIVVISDDITLPLGQLRIRLKGSAGGHNGLKNIILHLGSDDFARVKVGVGEEERKGELRDYVLGHFSKDEKDIIAEEIKKAGEAALMLATGSREEAMNLYNRKVKKSESTDETNSGKN